jgi:nucleotide-binding universal stress UspA family protein
VIGERPDAEGRTRADDVHMRRILIATDGSQSAAGAVSVGVDLAAEQGASVTFIHVVAPPITRPVRTHEIDLTAAAQLARERGVDADVAVVSGNAADEIVAYADMIDTDLIIVGSRGLTAAATAMLGSVSHDVLHEARRPVLVIRPAATRNEAFSHIES